MSSSDRTVVKVRLKDILKYRKHRTVLEGFVRKMNILCTHVYQFLRLWILSLDEAPEITIDTFKMCFKALTANENQRGPKPKGSNGELFEEFQEFYETTYSKLNYERLDATNLSSVSTYAFTQMKTAFENNIKSHYTNHVRRFVNKSFEQGSLPKKEFDQQLRAVKNDLFNDTLESLPEYHAWILKYKKRLIPDNHSIKNLYKNPQDYLQHMIYMSKKLERKGIKQFQFFPQRTSLVPKHITLDTKALVEMFSETKGEDLKHVNEIRNEVWGKVFKLNNKAFKRKKYTFDHMITTNGYEASILFVPSKEYEEHQQKLKNRAQAAKEARKLYKGKTDDEKEQIKNERLEEKQKNQKPKENPVPKKSEFTYLEDATDEEKKELKTHNYGLIDMGKIRIITMLNKANGKIFKHTRRDELRQTKRLLIAKKTLKLKKPSIEALETKLSKYSNKTCKFKKYKKYIKVRNKVLNELSEQYAIPQFRRFQFHLYINKTRTRDKLVGKIRSFLQDITPPNSNDSIKTDSDPMLIFGNWSANKNMKHMVATPGVGLKRYLLKHFKSYDIDEFRTSIINHKTEQRCENLYLGKPQRKIHSVLTYTMENGRLGCINRDVNAVLNMDKITNNILETGEYPHVFKRSTKLLSAVNLPNIDQQGGTSNNGTSSPASLMKNTGCMNSSPL